MNSVGVLGYILIQQEHKCESTQLARWLHTLTNQDVFYIKTSDGTDIAVFDLGVVNENEISYSYNTVEENVNSEPYDTEVRELLSELITKQILQMENE